MGIIFASLFCEFIIGLWMSWYLFINKHKLGATLTLVSIVSIIFLSYKVLI
jgi:hypothetical protein